MSGDFRFQWKCLISEECEGMEISSEQHVAGYPRYVHVWGFSFPVEVFNLISVFLKPLCRNSELVGCCIALLELLKSIGMHNGHECMHVISQDAYICVTCQSRI
jgi:hypothetical protein